MSLFQRFAGPLLTDATPETTFGGEDAKARMDKLRSVLVDLRATWPDNQRYNALLSTLKKYVEQTDQPEDVRSYLQRILDGYHDYADTDYGRPVKEQAERYDSLQLYCTKNGYDYFFKLHSNVLRAKDPEMDMVLTAATFLEFLTIDLYNLRLSNIGDEMFSNFQGITYRGMTVTAKDIDHYRLIASESDLENRHFAIPLGLVSSTTDLSVMELFSADRSSRGYPLHMTIHVHGIDPDLLAMYLERYPNSVVTSICAMPVARLSPFGEKEILLRGAWFHVVHMARNKEYGRDVYSLVVVMISANRDHTTESSSNEGPKAVQREVFRDCIKASRYEVCARLAEQYSKEDAEEYRRLQEKYIADLENLHFKTKINTTLANARSSTKATWLGGSLQMTYPRTYCSHRQSFRSAIMRSEWSKAIAILDSEYTWRLNDWFSIRDLRGDDGHSDDPKPGFTTLHILAGSAGARLQAPLQEDMDAWPRLYDLIRASGVWKTLRTLDSKLQTAQQLAQHSVDPSLEELLRPNIKHILPEQILDSLELQLHSLMQEVAAELIDKHAFVLPPLSILTEMETPELWVPIPHMHGGFNVELVDDTLEVTIYRTIPGKTQPHKSYRQIKADTVAGAAE